MTVGGRIIPNSLPFLEYTMASPDANTSGRKSVVSMRDMVERFRSAPPLPREERSADNMVLWWKAGPGTATGTDGASRSLTTANSILNGLGASLDGGALGLDDPAPACVDYFEFCRRQR